MNFIVLGGGCFGSFYVRQLLRGQDRLAFETIHVVDIKKDCQVFCEHGSLPKIHYHIQDWKAFFLSYLKQKIEDARKGLKTLDHYVPPTFAPHVLMEVFLEIFRENFPKTSIVPKVMEAPLHTPVDMSLPQGTRALSFATWMCPSSCIEPPICPHTRGPKDWDMKRYLQSHALSQEGSGDMYLFQCRHWAMGVGTIPVQEIVKEYLNFEKKSGQPGDHVVTMASVSSCHGLIGQVEVRHG